MTKGLVEIAVGQKWNQPEGPDGRKRTFIDELVDSMRSAHKHSPKVPIKVFIEGTREDAYRLQDVGATVFDIEPIIRKYDEMYGNVNVWQRMHRTSKSQVRFRACTIAKLMAIAESGFDQTFWLDTDCYVLKPWEHIFDTNADFSIADIGRGNDVEAGVVCVHTPLDQEYIDHVIHRWYVKNGSRNDQQVLRATHLGWARHRGMRVQRLNWWEWNVRPFDLTSSMFKGRPTGDTIILHSRFQTPGEFYDESYTIRNDSLQTEHDAAQGGGEEEA